MVDKALAIVLRRQGFSYLDISKQLGCSVAWCKLNLSGVDKGERQVDNETKQSAIAILKDALDKLEKL